MDFSNLFMRLLELSPFVATLFFFLFTIWNSMQKKDEALTTATREHQTNMLLMQKDSIMAQNNAADAARILADSNKQLAGVIVDFKEHISDKIDGLENRMPQRKLNGRPTLVTESKPAAA